ncbi:cellulose-growth-specific protein [Exidia glandulosa HHB12029]|uniref:AA9 family lytic polysaccharide monooxygenase n=1 Tax=Exidia glandulosa HHB12029 TaxID=1314781 RepID=A0A165LJ13_EXIGL|nr:cellulose-growth-specific protein [Exidia glandulosa HHB12029]
MKAALASAFALSQIAGVVAHGGVLSYDIAGTTYNGFVPYNTPVGQSSIQRIWNKYDPIQDVTLPILACNDNGLTLDLQKTASVAAGSKVVAFWNTWPHDTGPMLAYLAQCPGSTCTGVDPTTLKWFKIAEAGLISGTVGKGVWAAGQMIAANNSWTITIPSTVPAGNYLLRHETIALHSMPAQNYPECAQIQITGSGNVPPPASILVSFPGAYKQTDPGITIDIYSNAALTQTTYVIPGPPVYPGTGATTTTGPTSTVGSSSSSSSTSRPATTSTTATTTSSAPGATQTKYGQCGGQGWTGPTVCASGSTCTVSNQYYSQCL